MKELSQLREEKESFKKKIMEERLAEGRKKYMKEVAQEVEIELPEHLLSDVRPDLLHFLKKPDLFEKITKEFDKKIVGEGETRKVIFLFSCARLVLNCESTSSNLLVNDESGTGKDYVTKNVLSIYPKEIVEHKKRISPTTFTYWHNNHFEPEWSWDGKIFYGEDLSNNVLNSDTFKLMSSSEKGKLNTSCIVINQKAVDIGIKGKPVMIITMANSNPKSELLRRLPTIQLDGRVEQTKAIVKRQAEFKAKGVVADYDSIVREALGELRLVNVKIPFAEQLADVVSYDNIIMRTNFTRFCDLISFSTALHQFQRKRDGEGFLLSEGRDYEIARSAILAITCNKRSIPLTRKQGMLLEEFGKLENIPYSVKDLTKHIQFLSERQLYRELDKLVENGFLKRSVDIRYSSVNEEGEPCGTKREVTVYELVKYDRFELPSWEELQKNVSNDNDGKDDNQDKTVN